MQLNIHNIRDCDPQKLGHIDVTPHYVVRRYAEFASAISGLNQSFPSERVDGLLAQMQAEVEKFCRRLSNEFAQHRDQLVFLINNYDMILTTLTVRISLSFKNPLHLFCLSTLPLCFQSGGVEDSKEVEAFRGLVGGSVQEFIELSLLPHLGDLMQFVREAEAAAERGYLEQYRNDESSTLTLHT